MLRPQSHGNQVLWLFCPCFHGIRNECPLLAMSPCVIIEKRKGMTGVGKNGSIGLQRIALAALTLALLAGGCSDLESGSSAATEAPRSSPVETVNSELEAERLKAQRTAEEKRNSYLWPRESVQKKIMDEEVEFTLYHGNGWTIHVPASWEQKDSSTWEAPSQCASFSVSKAFLGVNNLKWYRAEMGAWRYETSYAPPFDYYYDDDGGYIPPAGNADYIYFFASAGERESYEFTLQTVVEETSEEEKCIQEAMLLSFSLDESSHVLNSGAYTPGKTEWEAAMAGLMAETERIWFSWYHGGRYIQLDGKGAPEYVTYVLRLDDFCPEEFIEQFFGKRPEGEENLGGEPITICLPEMRMWLYFYGDSPWVHVQQAGEDYWAKFYHKDDPGESIFDTVRTWLEAESAWAG